MLGRDAIYWSFVLHLIISLKIFISSNQIWEQKRALSSRPFRHTDGFLERHGSNVQEMNQFTLGSYLTILLQQWDDVSIFVFKNGGQW